MKHFFLSILAFLTRMGTEGISELFVVFLLLGAGFVGPLLEEASASGPFEATFCRLYSLVSFRFLGKVSLVTS